MKVQKQTPAHSPGDPDYDHTWDSLLETPALREARIDIHRAASLKRELFALPRHRRRVVASANFRFHSRGLAELLLSPEKNSPEERIETATLALAIAQALTVDDEVRSDLLARSLAIRANLFATHGKLLGAARDLTKAERLIRIFPALTEARALYLSALGRLRRQEGKLEEALALLSRAAELFADLGEGRVAATIFIEVGGLYLAFGEEDRALELFREVLVSAPLPGRLGLEVLQALVAGLILEERREEAAEILRLVADAVPSPSKEKMKLLSLVLGGKPVLSEFEELIQSLDEAGDKGGAALAALVLRGEEGIEIPSALVPFVPPDLLQLTSDLPPFSSDSYHTLIRELWTRDLEPGREGLTERTTY